VTNSGYWAPKNVWGQRKSTPTFWPPNPFCEKIPGPIVRDYFGREEISEGIQIRELMGGYKKSL